MDASILMILILSAAMMATVITGIPTSLRRPQTFHRFIYSLSGRSLVPLPMRIVLAGIQSTAATATAGTIYEVFDVTQTDALFGIGSELSLMCRKAFETGKLLGVGPRIFAIGITAPTGGSTAATQKTITVSGTATEAGNIILRVAGRTFTIGVANGDTAATAAAAIEKILDQFAEELPVTAGVSGAVVTTTHVAKGANGDDVAITVDAKPAGLTFVIATSVAGNGIVDIGTTLDALLPDEYDGIAIANHTAADITDINTHLASAWGVAEKKWRWIFVGEFGSIGTATSLASAANHHGCIVANVEGSPSLAGEIATAVCFGAFSRDRPNANYNGLKLPLFPPASATAFTGSEVETAIAAGLTALTPVLTSQRAIVPAVLKIERMITTKTTEGGNPFEPLRDLGVSRTGAFLARQVDIGYTSRFGADANPDGVLLTEDTEDQVEDMIKSILFAAEERSIIENVTKSLPELVVERDPDAIGRINTDIPYHVVVGLHQVANVHRVRVGG